MADNEQFFRIVVDYQSGLDALKKVEDALKDVKDRQKELIDEMKKGATSQEEYGTKMQDLTVKIKLYTDQRRQAIKVAKTITELNNAEEGSLVRLSAEYGRLYDVYRNMSREERNGKQGQILIQQLNEINNELATSEAAVGRYSRNVGNYASGFSPLNFQVQQLARELPSLTVSTQQFFLAISNNLPMLVDEMQRARVANEALKKAGETTVPVWKQMLKSIGSWQTMLVVGITLLTAYGKEIGQWVKELFRGKKAIADLTSASETMASSFAKDISNLGTLFNRLHDAKEGTEAYKRAKNDIISQYGKYLEGQREEIRTLQNQEAAYRLLTAAVIENARQKGLSEANEKATEKFGKAWAKAFDGVYAKFEAKFGEKEAGKIFETFQKGLVGSGGELKGPVLQAIYDQFTMQPEPFEITGEDGQKVRMYRDSTNELDKVLKKVSKAYSVLNGTILTAEQIYGGLSDKTRSLIREQEALLAEAKLAPESTEAEIKAKNAKIKKIEDEISRLKNLGVVTKQQLSEAKKAEKDAADAKKQLEDDTIKYMREGREKDLDKQELDYRREREKYKGNSEKLQEIEEWNHNQVSEINKKWNEKELDEYDKKLKAQLDLLEDGTDKKIALLKLERAKLVRQAIMNGASVVEATEQANKWYKTKEKEIRDATPEGKRDLKLAQIENTYEFEKACINQLDISDGERYKKLAELENKRRKDQADTAWAYIQQQYEAGKITQEVYEKNRKLYAGFYAEIANEAADIANIDTISAGGTSEKGLAKAAKRKSRQEKSNSFFGKLFGIDPKSKEGKAQIKQEKKELLNLAVDTARDIGQAVIDIQTEISQRRLKLEQERIDAERESELKSLELRYNKGLMSEKAYNKAVEATNAEADRKKEEAERAAFEREKRLKIMGIAIDTAAGITKVWSETGLTGWKLAMAVAQTAFLTANGIAQTAVISSQQFAKGGIVPIGNGKNGVSMGMLQGPSHSQGGIPLMVNGQPVNAEVEGGEILAVINKRSAAQYLPLFSAINATNGVKFENGGVIGSGWSLPTPAPLPPSQSQRDAETWAELRGLRNDVVRLAKIQGERVDNLKVYVVEKDITKAQKKVANIKAKATIIGGK
jgi:hypothetical protein